MPEPESKTRSDLLGEVATQSDAQYHPPEVWLVRRRRDSAAPPTPRSSVPSTNTTAARKWEDLPEGKWSDRPTEVVTVQLPDDVD